MRLGNTEEGALVIKPSQCAPMPQQKMSQGNLNPQIDQIYADA
jgi:hypothetical protein